MMRRVEPQWQKEIKKLISPVLNTLASPIYVFVYNLSREPKE